jgi:serine/threonine protein kinase
MLTPKTEGSPKTLGAYAYRLIRRIRKTRMSEVWLAEETTTGQRVIIKFALIGEFSDPNQRAILNDERWLRRLNHPAIIKLRPILEEPPGRDSIYRARALALLGTPWFIVEPYLDGGSVADTLERIRKFDLASTLRIASHMFGVLVYLRHAGCVHSDMKLANWVFVQKFDPTQADAWMWQPTLIDFGIAQNLGEKVVPAIAPGWSAPEVEQAYHNHTPIEADASWDVYGVGLILLALLTGQTKLDPDAAKRYQRIRLTRADLAANSWVTERDLDVIEHKLNDLIARAVNDAPVERPKAEEFVAELDALLRLFKPQPFWVRVTEPFFRGIIRREMKRHVSPVRTTPVPNWVSASIMAILIMVSSLTVMLGITPEVVLAWLNPPAAPLVVQAEVTQATPTIAPTVITDTFVATNQTTPGVEASPTSTVTVAILEQPTNTLTPTPAPSGTATPSPTNTSVERPTATATASPTETATATVTPTTAPTLTRAPTVREPATLIASPTLTTTITVTPTLPAPTRPPLNQGVVIQKHPLSGDALRVKEPEANKLNRERIFAWEFPKGFNRRGVCAELVFRYPLQNGSLKTDVVADVSKQTTHTVDLPGWFTGKPVSYGGVTFAWGVRIFYCGSSRRAEPAEWRSFTLTRE